MSAFLKLTGIVAALLIAFLLTPRAVLAQGYATIRGTVTDSTGAVIPGAEVTATRASTGLMLKTTTNAEGTYVFPSLAPTVYDISVSHVGFAAYTEKGVQANADAAVTANVTLKTGSTTETVTVSSQSAQVDVTTGTLSQVIGTAAGERSATEWPQCSHTDCPGRGSHGCAVCPG